MLVFSLLPSVLLLLLLELGVRVVFYQVNAPFPLGVIHLYNDIAARLRPKFQMSRIVASEPLSRADPVVGYSGIPGIHPVSFMREEQTLMTEAIIGPDGYRTGLGEPSDHLYRYARAFFTPEGSFETELVSLNHNWANTQSYAILVTKIIFYRIWKLSTSRGILPVFALQTGSRTDPVAQYARDIGFQVIDISFDLTKKYTSIPYDIHPNRRAHMGYRDLLLAGLKPVLKSTQQSKSSNAGTTGLGEPAR